MTYDPAVPVSWRARFLLFLSRPGLMLLTVATALNVGWGLLAILSPRPLDTVATAQLYDWLGQDAGGLVLLSVALLAAYGIARPGRRGLTMGMFQNALLLLAAGNALWAVSQGRYADGVVRPWDFILTDQLLAIVVAFGHLVSLFIYHGLAEANNRARGEEGV